MAPAAGPERDPLLEHGLNRDEKSPPPRFVVAGLTSDQYFTADPVGDVGRREYVQAINSDRGVEVGVFDKRGNPLRPGFRLGDLWKSAGRDDACANTSSTDPVVIYDHLANRWVLTQITAEGKTHDVCLAISKSPDPLGSYFLYHVGPLDFFPDYLKCGLWPDGYLGTIALESGSHLPMQRLQYRRMGKHDSLVGNIAVGAGAGAKEHLAIRWYQVRRTRRGPWRLAQEGTYGPSDEYRFYGSAAMNADGDLAVGYSISGTDIYPSIRYAVRAADDPRGTLRQEGVLREGKARKDFPPNWGDYSAMVVDPVDQSTFWYTNMTVDELTGLRQTWIGKIPAPACAKGPAGPHARDDEPGEDDGTR